MPRKTLLIISLVLVCISQILLASYTLINNTAANGNGQPENNPPEIPESPKFEIPESPVGTLGLVGALAVAFGMFAIARRKRPSLLR